MLCKMAEEQQDVTFVKLNCNKYNKELGKQLGTLPDPTGLSSTTSRCLGVFRCP